MVENIYNCTTVHYLLLKDEMPFGHHHFIKKKIKSLVLEYSIVSEMEKLKPGIRLFPNRSINLYFNYCITPKEL